MDKIKLFESERKLMELLWAQEPTTAKELSLLAEEAYGWNKNTTYTVIKKLVEKGAVKRSEPAFQCASLIRRQDVAREETKTLINRLFGGSKKAFFSAFLEDEGLTGEELEELKKMIEKR